MSRRRKPVHPRVEPLEPRIVLGYYGADSLGPVPAAGTCDCMTPTAVSKATPFDGHGSSGTTNAPVRFFDGTPIIVANDLRAASSPAGFAWGLTRTWSGLNNSGPVGNGWAVGEVPQVVVGGGTNGAGLPGDPIGSGGVASGTSGDDRLSVVAGGTSSYTFAVSDTGSGFAYVPWGADKLKLELVSGPTPVLRLTDATGNVTEFYDVERDGNGKPINSSMAAGPAKYGQFKSFASPGGTRVDAAYDSNGYLTSETLTGPASAAIERISYAYATITNDLVTAASGAVAKVTSSVTLERPDGIGGWTPVQRSVYDYYTGRVAGPDDDPNGRLGDLKSAQVEDAKVSGGVVTWQAIDASYYRYFKFTGEAYGTIDQGPANVKDTTGGPTPLQDAGYSDFLVSSGLKTVITGESLARLAADLPGYESATDAAIRPYVNNLFTYERWDDHVGADPLGASVEWRTSYRMGTRYRVVEELAQGEGCSCATGQGTYKYQYTPNYKSAGMGYNSIERNTWRMQTTEYLPSNAGGWATHDRRISFTNEVGQSMLDVFVDVDDTAYAVSAVSPTGSGWTIRVTAPGHTFAVGNRAAITGVLPALYSGVFTVTGVGTDYFDFTLPSTYTRFDFPPSVTSSTGMSATKVLGEWATYHRYDAAGREILTAEPSAVIDYDPNLADTVDFANAGYPHLKSGSGLFQTFDYSTATTASGSTAGEVIGYFHAAYVRQGMTGTPVVQATQTYYAHASSGGVASYVVAASTTYGLDSGSATDFSDRDPRTTTYAYTWASGTNLVASMAVSRPVVSAAQDGPGVADVDTVAYDAYGRPAWMKDADGFLHYTEYDAVTGAVTRTIVDVNTALSGTPAGLPTGWATPASGGLNLITSYQVDALGRITLEVDPDNRVTYWVYNDAAHEVRTYRGWDATAGTTTGPIEVTRDDWARGYRESFIMAATPSHSGAAGSLVPTGAETISDLRTLTRELLDQSNRVKEVDRYFLLAGLTYAATTATLGALGTNDDVTTYGFDDRGRQVRTKDAVGTITILVYDGLGRVIETYVGTDDSTANGWRWTPATAGPNSNMIRVASYQYDGGGIGDGNLTQSTAYPGGGAADRVARYAYDWRDRLVATKGGVQSGVESTDTQRPITYLDLDNLGEVVGLSRFDGDGVTLSATTKPSSSLLRASTTTAYDAQGRAFIQRMYSVDQSTGVKSTYSLATSTYYDHRGNVVATYAPGGLVTKDRYDGAGRVVDQAKTDGAGGATWAAATSLASDHVLEEARTTYDGAGHPILVANLQRFHDTADTGPLVGPSPAATPGVGDPGIEEAPVGPGAFSYRPSGSAWTFTGDSGVSGESSGFLTTAQVPADGHQVAFLQNAGSFSQTVAGWAAGTYTLSFAAAKRALAGYGDQDFQVLVDSTVVGTFTPTSTSFLLYATAPFVVAAGSHTITFQGLNTAGGDNTAFIDTISVASTAVTAPTLGDASFEAVAVGTNDYAYHPSGSAWAFSGDSGIATGSSGFVASWQVPPDGGQVAFLQGTGSFSQTVAGWAAGTYTLSFAAAKRVLGGDQNFQVLVDSVVVGTFAPTSTSFSTYATAPFAVAAGSHTITFQGLNTAGGDNTALIDAVSVAITPLDARAYYSAYYYDAASRPTDAVDVGTNGGAYYARPASASARSDAAHVTSYHYDDAGWVDRVTDPRGIVARTKHDALGRATEVVAAYVDGVVAANESATDNTTRYAYDGLGHVTYVTAVLATTTSTNKLQVTTYKYGVTTAGGSAVASNDLLAAVVQPDEATGLEPTTNLAAHSVAYKYNALGQVVAMTDANGTVHAYGYDVLGRQASDSVTAIVDPDIDGAVRRLETAYDTAGRAYLFTSYDAATGGVVVNQVLDRFNGLGQLTAEYQEHSGAVNTSTSAKVQYAYTEMAGGQNNSRMTSMAYPNGRVVDYTYDAGIDSAIGRLSSIADDASGSPATVLESYKYLGLGTVVERARPQERVKLTYVRQLGDAYAKADAGDQYTGLDRFGRVVDQDWVRTAASDGAAAAGTPTVRLQYAYDRDANATSRRDLVNTALSELYAYDQLNRLTSMKRGVLSASTTGGPLDTITTPNRQQSWTLDALGNWSGVATGSTTITRDFDAANQATSVSGASTPAYDHAGNTTADIDGRSFAYDAWNRLVAMKVGSATTAAYAYDALGRRVVETRPGSSTTHVYFTPDWQAIEERVGGTASGDVAYQYVLGLASRVVLRDGYASGSLVASARRFAEQDANGDTMALVYHGDAQERYAYDAYGTVTIMDGGGAVRTYGQSELFRNLFQGGRFDYATRLYSFQHRDLDPASGVWMEHDPLGQAAGDANLYRFVDNQPIIANDPTGLAKKIKKFKTPEEAAYDWAMTYNGKSICNKREYTSMIYRTRDKKHYSYTDPESKNSTGDYDSSKGGLPNNPANIDNAFADIHSHANYDPKYRSNEFSPTDIDVYNKSNFIGFVSTPNGCLLKYDPFKKKEDRIRLISDQIPSDPNDPDRRNNISPNRK